MINSIHIQNFQSHKDTKIELHKGVNTLIGSSDSGKSSIIRAIRLAVYGKPRGDAYRSWWGGDTFVSLETDTGKVKRIKTKTENSYTINDGEPFKALGNDIPPEVTAILNMDSINLQKQLDKPFLLDETPGAVASHFNRMADLEKIDEVTSKINSKIKANKASIDINEANITEYKTNIKTYSYLKGAEISIKEIETLQEKKRNNEQTAENVERLYLAIEKIQKDIDVNKSLLKAEKPLTNIITLKDGETSLKTLKIL